jgi:hypothetical protein
VITAERPQQVVLVVDIANVMGSRPDGWWRDRAGAASRLLAELEVLDGAVVAGPTGVQAVRITAVHAVVEGAAKHVPSAGAVTVVSAPRDGDSEIVEEARRLTAGGTTPLVVTADRGLRARLPETALLAGPGWLNRLLGR